MSKQKFQTEIIESIVKGYQEGITPSPCSKCNRFVKFSPMLDWTEKNESKKGFIEPRITFGEDSGYLEMDGDNLHLPGTRMIHNFS